MLKKLLNMSMRKEIIINKRKKKEKENIIWQSIKLLNKLN
jgi:hypothetical protein